MFARSATVVLLACALIAAALYSSSARRAPAPATPPPQILEDARKAYQEGLKAEDEGRYGAAIGHYSRVIELDPRDDSAYLHRGICRLGAGDSDPAIADFSQALQLQPENSRAYQLRAVAYYRNGQYAEAIVDLDEAIQRNPTIATYYVLRGQTRAIQRQPDRAIDDYTQALNLESSAQAHLDRAEAFLRIGERGRASADLNRALILGAKLERPAGLLALLQPERPPSRTPVTAFAAVDPKRDREAIDRTFQARSRVARGLYEEAFALFEEAIRLSPSLALAYNSRGYAHLRAKSYAEAIEDFSEAIRLNASYLNAYQNRSVARRLAGDREGYLEDQRRAQSLRRRSPRN